MSGHTKGPWEINRVPGGRGVKRYVDPAGRYGSVAHVLAESTTPETAEANARLIAAAPELLEAARELTRWYTLTDKHDVYGPSHPISKLRAAISQAEGTPETRTTQ